MKLFRLDQFHLENRNDLSFEQNQSTKKSKQGVSKNSMNYQDSLCKKKLCNLNQLCSKFYNLVDSKRKDEMPSLFSKNKVLGQRIITLQNIEERSYCFILQKKPNYKASPLDMIKEKEQGKERSVYLKMLIKKLKNFMNRNHVDYDEINKCLFYFVLQIVIIIYKIYLSQNTMKPWNKNRANSLLLKDQVGAAKQSIYTIPNDIYFGKAIVHDNEGAQQVTSSWYYHNNSEENHQDRDFMKLNKMCISSKLHDQKQFYLFRKSNDAKVFRRRGCSQIEMNLPDENFRYGKPYLPQSPMKNILGGSYMNEAEQLMDKKYDAISKYKQQQNKRPSTATKHTKASKLAYQNLVKSLNKTQQPQFKLKEFEQVEPKTKTRF